MALTQQEKHKLKKFIKDLRGFRGRHTELVSVYIPAGYEITKIIQHLQQEAGTATNIKDATTRRNVIDALEKLVQHLRLFKKTPAHGLAAFSGNVAAQQGKQDFQVFSIEPPVPLNTRIYRCDKTFVLNLLEDMMDDKEVYGLIVLDRRDANIAYLKGKSIVPLLKTHSEVPGKYRTGGQCLVRDSLVQLADGSLPRIATVHNPHIVKSVIITDSCKIQDSDVTDKWDVKKKDVYKIVTTSPRLEIQSSPDHVFFVSTEKGIVEKPASKLTEGDYLIMPEKLEVRGKNHKLSSMQHYNAFCVNKQGRNVLKKERLSRGLLQSELARKAGVLQTTVSYLEIGRQNAKKATLEKICDFLEIDFQNFLNSYCRAAKHKGASIHLPDHLDKKFSQFLGYYLREGSKETDRITFFEKDKQVAVVYQKLFESYFRTSVSYRFRSASNYHQLRFTSRPLVRLISSEFPELKKTHDSLIPEKVLASSNTVLASFLRGFFDAEGYVREERGIQLGINNKLLAQQIQMALLRFSIIGSLNEHDKRANPYSLNPQFTVDISEGESLRLFSKFIEFTSEVKSRKLKTAIAQKSEKSTVRQILIPGRTIRNIIESHRHKVSHFPKVSNFFRSERMMSKQTFKQSLLSQVKNRKLHNKLLAIYKNPLLPVKISSIERTPKNVEMVDISVKNQNFIANGVLVHNSAQRFARIREGAAKEHYKKVAEYVKQQFLDNTDLKGIIVGGPGPTKYEFVDGDFITNELQKKIIGIKDLSYTGDFGLQELVDKSEDLLAEEELMAEKKAMHRFFDYLNKNPSMVSYGEKEVMERVQQGAVELLLLSDEFDDEKIEQFEEAAEKLGSAVMLVSTETREGVQLKEMGKIAAVLRYAIDA